MARELAAVGVTDMPQANSYLREQYLPEFNREFMQPAREEGSAFVPTRFSRPEGDPVRALRADRAAR